MFSWKKAAMVSCLAFVFSCQSTPFNRTVAQVEDQENQEVKYFDRLQDYTPYKYEVLFTDPVCGVYNYTEEVLSNSGKKLKQKPENVYCKAQYDKYRSANRPQSPQFRLIEWINSPDTKEIFFTYLSFSNKNVKEALCEAAKRGVKIRFVIETAPAGDPTLAMSEELLKCNQGDKIMVERKLRGQENDLGYAHNKFFIINPNTKKEFKIVFSSGNMSSGPVTHHENWNFVTTNVNSQFAQAHLCAMNAEWDEVDGRSRQAYMKAIKNCRAKIKAPEEKDIKVFFVPGEGEGEGKEVGITKKSAFDFMKGDTKLNVLGISNAKRIWMACHRFSYRKMLNALEYRMTNKYGPADLRIVCDDDTYYKAVDPNYTLGGDMQGNEFQNMEKLRNLGAKLKFMETNGTQSQLHHSKYLIFADKNTGEAKASDFKAVFTGSANLTGAAFNRNWENSYYITIPHVVDSFATHYVYTWNKLATAIEDLPNKGEVDTLLIDQPIIQNKTENK